MAQLPPVLGKLWSMWHILVRLVDECREIWGSCAIYVGIPSLILANEWELRPLCPKKAAWCWEKKGGETSAVLPIFHLGSPRKTDPTKCQVSFGKLRKKQLFGGLGGARFPGPSKVANCQSVEDCKKYVIFRDIDGATPTHSPKSGWECHIDGATPSYLPTPINQPNQNMLHRSELSQGRRQNHQERHQSCPKTGGKTTRKDIRVIHQERHQSCPFWDIDGATDFIQYKFVQFHRIYKQKWQEM